MFIETWIMLRYCYAYILLLFIVLPPLAYAASCNPYRSESEAKHADQVAEQQREEERKKEEELRAEAERYAREQNKAKAEADQEKIVTSVKDLVLFHCEEKKNGIAIFDIPEQITVYNLTPEEIKRAKETFQIYEAEITKSGHQVIKFRYSDERLLPENKDQAVLLLYRPYVINIDSAQQPIYTSSILNDAQKKEICGEISQSPEIIKLKAALLKKAVDYQEGLVGSTQIKTNNGYSKLEDIKAGDLVACYDITNSKQIYNRVSGVDNVCLKKYVQITTNNQQIIKVAAEHRFYIPTSDAWISAEDLVEYPAFMKLINPNIEEIRLVNEELEVIRISVEGNHNFYITDHDILVHNSDIALESAFVIGRVAIALFPCPYTPVFIQGLNLAQAYVNLSKIVSVQNSNIKAIANTIPEQAYYEKAKSELLKVRKDLIDVKEGLEKLVQYRRPYGANFTSALLYQTKLQDGIDSTLKVTPEQELQYNDQQKESLRALRQAELDKLAKQVSDLQIALGFHFDELINMRDRAQVELEAMDANLTQAINTWNTHRDNLSDSAMIPIYEALRKYEECAQNVENKNQELKFAIEYYKNVHNASIIKVTTNIPELVTLGENEVATTEAWIVQQRKQCITPNVEIIEKELYRNGIDVTNLRNNIESSLKKQRASKISKELEEAKKAKASIKPPKNPKEDKEKKDIQLKEKFSEYIKKEADYKECLEKAKKVKNKTLDTPIKDYWRDCNANGAQLDKRANDLYTEIRNTVGDTKKVADNLQIKESFVSRVKNHVFYKKHSLKNGVATFDPDLNMGECWKRLSNNTYVKSDLEWFLHEFVESKLMERFSDIEQETIHNFTNTLHDWLKLLK